MGTKATCRIRDARGIYRSIDQDALIENARQCVLDKFKAGLTISSPAVAQSYLQTMLAGHDHEVFAVLFLNNRHQVLCYQELFRGTIDGTSVYPREVVKEALTKNAATVILAHNHQ